MEIAVFRKDSCRVTVVLQQQAPPMLMSTASGPVSSQIGPICMEIAVFRKNSCRVRVVLQQQAPPMLMSLSAGPVARIRLGPHVVAEGLTRWSHLQRNTLVLLDCCTFPPWTMTKPSGPWNSILPWYLEPPESQEFPLELLQRPPTPALSPRLSPVPVPVPAHSQWYIPKVAWEVARCSVARPRFHANQVPREQVQKWHFCKDSPIGNGRLLRCSDTSDH